MLSINSHITVDSSNVFLFPRLPSRFDHPSRAEYPFEICKINVNINYSIDFNTSATSSSLLFGSRFLLNVF
ncbi:hypothetical protein B9Z55_004102 [Caenorhabditis nigoni]|uniref:Uncharacterized protein n=1 Tax=Caenorhabditis nigoni TaxID=1611254 RepID=A0A2G5UVR4_9PELO|nr:hypothetical protein B9Z55_004102 [Caenorhabditis nigoni]